MCSHSPQLEAAGRPYCDLSLHKGACKKGGGRPFSQACSNKRKNNGFKLKEGWFRPYVRKKFFYNEGSETLEQVAHRAGRRHIPGNIQGQGGRGSK